MHRPQRRSDNLTASSVRGLPLTLPVSVIVRVALVAMRRAVAMPVIVLAMAVMVVIMAAAAALAMGVLMMLVLVRVLVTVMAVIMRMAVIVAMVIVAMMVIVMMVVPAAAIVAMRVVMHRRLGLEGTLDLGHRTALPAHQLGQRRIAGNIERVGGHFGRDVMAAEMPGEAHQAQRVLGADLQQALRCRLDLDEAAVVELQRIAVVQHRGLIERDREFQAACPRHRHAVDVAVAMAEAERIDDALGADGSLAKNGSGAEHLRRSHGLRPGTMRARARIAA